MSLAQTAVGVSDSKRQPWSIGCQKHATNPKLLELGGSCPLGKLRLLSMVNIPKSKAMVLVEILSDKAMSLGDKGINCTSKCLR